MASTSLGRPVGRFPHAPTVAILTLTLLTLPQRSPAQISAEESAKLLRPAPGLAATLWAAEPLVINPTAIDVDSRGRVWIAEGLNYRYTLHRDQPFFEEADRIKILEDTDGDGRADKVTVFADHIFPIPMGLAVEEHWSPSGQYLGSRVYTGNSPDLLVLDDTDGDDKADTRAALLTGFGGVDHDHGVHGFTFGPDGKLYFTQGDGASKSKPGYQYEVIDASGRRVANNQLATTLRVDRDGTNFEIIADRQRNNYETSLNSFGNIFTSDNDDDGNRGSRVIWVMDGGRYGYRTPGSPRHWGEEVPGNVPKLVGTGNGSPSGIMYYEGTLLPPEFQDSVFEVDAGTRQVNHFPITRDGAAFRTEAKVLLHGEDPWFRPIDAVAAPDGSILVADWYDGGVGGHAFRDQTTGRIFRVAPPGETPLMTPDFATIPGLIAALGSPNIATRDVARRLLIQRGEEPDTLKAVRAAAGDSANPILRARSLWILKAIAGPVAIRPLLADPDPRFRELAVRMLGQDNRENGEVSYTRDGARLEPAALAHLDAILPLASDSDAGVRRELILALRNVSTDRCGDALRTLAAGWDGQDRWYLEALGLALRGRESAFLASLFDGTLYGPLNLETAGKAAEPQALPPYFPVDRNEAFMAKGETLPPATPLGKNLGLMWQIHSPEVLTLLGQILPALEASSLIDAADDVLIQIRDPRGAVTLAQVAVATPDPARRNRMFGTLARRLESEWKPALTEPAIIAAIDHAFGDLETRVEGIRLAAIAGTETYQGRIAHIAEEPGAPDAMRVAAVESVARLPRAEGVLLNLVSEARRERSATPATEAAVRTLARLGGTREALSQIVSDNTVPLALRREALRGYAQQEGGGQSLVQMADNDQVPDELRTEAALVLRSHPDRGVRDRALELYPIKTADGQPLPSIGDLVRQDGDPERGREVFFRQPDPSVGHIGLSCASCHRVQGRGQWIGPDLSTIGTKYGKEELLRSILNPSAAIGYNVKTLNLATTDGRVLTGLPLEDSPERLVLKTADGDRITLRPDEVEERQFSDVSLMPEGLAETMGTQDLVDLLAYLATLKKPVSIVGAAQLIGPLVDPDQRLGGLDPIAVDQPIAHAGTSHAWRRGTASAEGVFDIGSLPNADHAALLHVPLKSPADQPAELVIESPAQVSAWLDGQEISLSVDAGNIHRASVQLAPQPMNLVIRLRGVDTGNTPGSLVATLVSGTPVEFSQ